MKQTLIKKIKEQYLHEIANGNKTFEIRKEDDHIYKVGEIIKLQSISTNRSVLIQIKYVLRDVEEYGLMKGYCIFSFEKLRCCSD